MNILNVNSPLSGANSASRIDSKKAPALSLAAYGSELLVPELIAWIDRSNAMAPTVLEGCAGPNGWHDYGASHGGLLEVGDGGKTCFIFTDSSPFDSYDHFGRGSFVNLRDTEGKKMICLVWGRACAPLDDWTGKFT
jgi:hypothetical protein